MAFAFPSPPFHHYLLALSLPPLGGVGSGAIGGGGGGGAVWGVGVARAMPPTTPSLFAA